MSDSSRKERDKPAFSEGWVAAALMFRWDIGIGYKSRFDESSVECIMESVRTLIRQEK